MLFVIQKTRLFVKIFFKIKKLLGFMAHILYHNHFQRILLFNMQNFIKKSLMTVLVFSTLSACSHLPTFAEKKSAKAPLIAPEKHRHTYQLDNGLKIIIQEDHRSPVVISQIWYKVGSNHEPKNLGGISHLLEHMMFKGTNKVSASDFERLIAKFGGSNNAFTSHDYTAYYEIFPANRLSLALELEADRMSNLQLKQSDFDSERLVVMEERRQRTDDNPQAVAYEQFLKIVYPNTPKREPVIGPMAEIENIRLDDLKNWYNTWYAPNNATIVIVGDVNADEAFHQVKKYFGDKVAKPLPKPPILTQTAFRGYQEKTVKLPVNVPSLIMAYNLPTLTTAKNPNTAYSLSLLSEILDGGLSARLEKNLVRDKQILASVGSSYNAFSAGDGLFTIQATPRDGITLAQARQAILAEIETIKTKPILDSELERAKTSTVTGLVYSQDSLTGQAQMIGRLNSIGLDERTIYQLPIIFEKIDKKDIQKVAKKYLKHENLTVLNVISDKQ